MTDPNTTLGPHPNRPTEISAERWRTALRLTPAELWLRALDAYHGFVNNGYITRMDAGTAHSEPIGLPGTPWAEVSASRRREIVREWGTFLVNLGSHLQPSLHRGIREDLGESITKVRRVKIHDLTASHVTGLTHVKGAVMVSLQRHEFSHAGWDYEDRWEVWDWDAQVSPAGLTQVQENMVKVSHWLSAGSMEKARELYERRATPLRLEAEPTEPAAPTDPPAPTWAVCETSAGTLELQRDDERAANMTDAEAAVLALQAVNNGEVDMAEATRVMIAVAGDLSLRLGMGRREVQMLQARLRYLSRSRLADALPDND